MEDSCKTFPIGQLLGTLFQRPDIAGGQDKIDEVVRHLDGCVSQIYMQHPRLADMRPGLMLDRIERENWVHNVGCILGKSLVLRKPQDRIGDTSK